MARRKTNWTVAWVRTGQDGPVHCHKVYGDDLEAAKQALVDLAEAQPMLFPAPPVPFSMGIVIGKPDAPARKKPAAKRGKGKPEAGAEVTTGAPNGATNPLDAEA